MTDLANQRSDLADALGSLSVVIPAYNAKSYVDSTLDAVQAFLTSRGLPHEIIVVDDGSTDDTPGRLEKRAAGLRVIRNDVNRGKGFSVRRGMLAAKMAWGLFMDVDHSTRIENLGSFAEFASSADVIIASRRVPGASRPFFST